MQDSQRDPARDVNFYLGVYAVLCILTIVIDTLRKSRSAKSVAQADRLPRPAEWLILYIGGIRASTRMYKGMSVFVICAYRVV